MGNVDENLSKKDPDGKDRDTELGNIKNSQPTGAPEAYFLVMLFHMGTFMEKILSWIFDSPIEKDALKSMMENYFKIGQTTFPISFAILFAGLQKSTSGTMIAAKLLQVTGLVVFILSSITLSASMNPSASNIRARVARITIFLNFLLFFVIIVLAVALA